jgi:predicted nucleic acid-binding protein
MEVVLDSSVALAWAFPDEGSARAERLLARASRRDGFWVPALWWYEIANALTMAERRGRLPEADRLRLTELFGMLPLHTDTFLDSDIAWRLHVLAREYALSAYDAAYLELAQRRGLALATLDRRLSRAARLAGVRVMVGSRQAR